MRHFKKHLALLLTFCILFGTVAFSADTGFREDTEYNYLRYISGTATNALFNPDSDLTRADAAKMLYYVLKLDNAEKASDFNDVSRDHPAYQAISDLSAAKILNGYSGNLFKPDNGLTRAEFCAILSRIMETPLSENVTDKFGDIENHWAAREISALTQLGFINGYSDNTFRPDKNLTRAEAVKLINKALNIEPDSDETRKVFSDLPETHWAYYDVMAVTSSTALETAVKRGNTKFEDIKYLDIDIEKIKNKCDGLLKEYDTASAARKAEIYREFEKLNRDYDTAVTMTSINTERDVKNEKYLRDKIALPEIGNLISEKELELYEKMVKDPDDELFDILGIPRDDLERPESPLDDELIELFTEESRLENEFNDFMYGTVIYKEGDVSYSLSDAQYSDNEKAYRKAFEYYERNYKKLGDIFDALVDVRTRLANYYGLLNYVQIGYLRSGKNNYSPDDTEVFRNEVKKYLVPLLKKIREARDNENTAYIFPDIEEIDASRDIIAELNEIFKDMSPQTRQAMKYMQDYNMFDLEPRANKSSTGFSTIIKEYLSPFMFMNSNSGYSNFSTFTHEFGHCFQAFRTYTENYTPSIAPDTAEIASQGMEALMTNAYGVLFDEESAKQYELWLLYDYIYSIVSTSMIDEFQIEVYKKPDMTVEQRNSLYIKIRNEYFDKYPPNVYNAFGKGIIWDNAFHIYCAPFYAIDYALSATTALQIWNMAKTDFDSAFETYMRVVESPFTPLGIEAVCIFAGLNNPFEEGLLESVSEMLTSKFKKSDTAKKAA